MRNRIWIASALAMLLVSVIVASAGATSTRSHSQHVSANQLRSTMLHRLTSHGSRFAAGSSADAVAPCGKPTGVLCTDVVVPLDRTGVVLGTISLHVEILPASGTPRGTIFLIAGGPGQGSARSYALGDASAVNLYHFLFPGYTLVAYDDRGTGDSGLLDCPTLQKANTADTERAAAGACAAQIGPARDFYSTGDHAEDLEAVRQALGVDKIALFGVSYGTKLALAYALAHPDHVERLLLDSVLPTNLPDPFATDVLRQMPATLNAFCSDGGCKGATSNFASDVAAVANKLAAKPLQGTIAGHKMRIDGLEVLTVMLDADLNPGLAAELPAVMKAARDGNTQPLVRTAYLHDGGSAEDAADLSFALYAATDCHDGPFPWDPATPPEQRSALEQAAISALPPGSLGPFGSWAARFGNADFCLDWPSPAGGAPLGAGPLPDVPMLAISGGFDMRTPTAGAASVVAQFPQGHLLVVPGVGHSTVTADFSLCAARAVRSWITAGTVPATCPRAKPLVLDVPGLPAPGQAKPAHRASPAKTYQIVTKTIREVQAAWLMTIGLSGSAAPVPGIFGGYMRATASDDFKLVNYSIARGVAVSGTLTLKAFGPPLVFQGTITVSGAGAAQGLLILNSKGALHGTLGARLF
jgi:pimeloyl-ACP methyl ester carboxylesterase